MTKRLMGTRAVNGLGTVKQGSGRAVRISNLSGAWEDGVMVLSGERVYTLSADLVAAIADYVNERRARERDDS